MRFFGIKRTALECHIVRYHSGNVQDFSGKAPGRDPAPRAPKTRFLLGTREKTMGLALFFPLRAGNSTIGICSEIPFDRY